MDAGSDICRWKTSYYSSVLSHCGPIPFFGIPVQNSSFNFINTDTRDLSGNLWLSDWGVASSQIHPPICFLFCWGLHFFFLSCDNMETVCSIDVLLRGITHRVFEFEFYSKTALLSLAFSLHVFSLFSKTHVFADDIVIIFSITLWPSFWLVDLPCLDLKNRASSIP